MKKILVLLFAFLMVVLVCTCSKEQPRALNVDFSYSAVNENYTAPSAIRITNATVGADYFLWTFEGASPTSSNNKSPGTIHYAYPGSYTISLAAWNNSERKESSQVIQIDAEMTLDFEIVFTNNDTLPSIVQCINKSSGASSYTWSFEGATPAVQTVQQPETVVYTFGEQHEIVLTAANGRISRSISKTIRFKPELVALFDIIPNEECYDYQVPFIAKLKNSSISAAAFLWQCSGGTFSNNSDREPLLYIDNPGTYTVNLQASNSKDSKNATQSIVISPNTNLYYFQELKFGIVRAGAAVGYAFSSKSRAVLNEEELTTTDGQTIDLVFLGINANFDMCRFLSPDSSAFYSLYPIVNVQKTAVINKSETGSPNLSIADFDNMENDLPLQPLAIAAHDSGRAFFSKDEGQRVVLFETEDGRKGAVKVIDFVSDGDNSFLLCDIKIQKQPL
ncbi:MAG: hypothetical protein FWH23_07335 [Bacteroidales bacterium]|nr:hypothetical protein [Bacteroidales bacterium]